MERSSFFNSVGGDRKYKAEDWASYFGSFIGNGVFPLPSTGLQVVADRGMNVTIKEGKAWINGYFYANTSDLTLTLSTADGVLYRNDRIVIRWDLTERTMSARVKSSAPATNPTVPPLQRDADAFELCIADVLVGQGVTAISQANITDQRFDTSLCGMVAGVVTQIDTTAFNAQLQAWYNEFKTETTQNYELFAAQFQAWISAFKNDNTRDYEEWFEAFKQDTAMDHETWFAALQEILDRANAIASKSGIMDAITDLYDKVIASPIRPLNQRTGGLWCDTSDGSTEVEDVGGEGQTSLPGIAISSEDPKETALLWFETM